MIKSRYYIILGRHKKTGKIVGVDHELRLNVDRVAIIREYPSTFNVTKTLTAKLKQGQTLRYNTHSVAQFQYKYLRNYYCHLAAKKYKRYRFKVYRGGSKHCPVKVDWSERAQMDKTARALDTKKYNYRNARFAVKEKDTHS